jgi:hypothetical protein
MLYRETSFVCRKKNKDEYTLCGYHTAFLGASENCEKQLLASSRLSTWNISAPTGRVFTKFDI